MKKHCSKTDNLCWTPLNKKMEFVKSKSMDWIQCPNIGSAGKNSANHYNQSTKYTAWSIIICHLDKQQEKHKRLNNAPKFEANISVL